MRFRSVIAGSVFAAGLVAATLAPAASATEAALAKPTSHLVSTRTTAMTVHHQVSAVRVGARVVVTLDKGAAFSMPAKEYEAAQTRFQSGARLLDTVFGDCGYSYTYLYDWGNNTYRLAVGFHVDAPAVAYSWSAYTQGAGSTYYDYHYTDSGALAWDSDWAGGHTGTVPAADYYDADTDYGAAELWYGTWCFAGYTSDSTYVS